MRKKSVHRRSFVRQCTLRWWTRPMTQNLPRVLLLKSVAPTPIPACPVESRPLSPRPARFEYTASFSEEKWPRTIKTECCKPNTESPACGVVPFRRSTMRRAAMPSRIPGLAAPVCGWLRTTENPSATAPFPPARDRCFRGDSSRLRRQIPLQREMQGPDPPPLKKFKLLRSILAKILTIPNLVLVQFLNQNPTGKGTIGPGRQRGAT
jgi:hypothetical protein